MRPRRIVATTLVVACGATSLAACAAVLGFEDVSLGTSATDGSTSTDAPAGPRDDAAGDAGVTDAARVDCTAANTLCDGFDTDADPGTRGWSSRLWGAGSAAVVGEGGRSTPRALLSTMGDAGEVCRMAQLFYEMKPLQASRVAATFAMRHTSGDGEGVAQLVLGQDCKVVLRPSTAAADSVVEVESPSTNTFRTSIGAQPMGVWQSFFVELDTTRRKLTVAVEGATVADVSLPTTCVPAIPTLYLGGHCVAPGRDVVIQFDDVVLEAR